MQNHSAFTLVEALLGLVLLSLIAVGAAWILSGANKSQGRLFAKKSLRSDMLLYQSILKAGTLASSCVKVGESHLRCRVDDSATPTSDTTDDRLVEFSLREISDCRNESRCVHYIRDLNGNNDLTDDTPLIFDNVEAFTLCSDTDMESDSCAIEPASISLSHKVNLDTTQTTFDTDRDRFFRFAVVGKSEKGATRKLQGAFFRRNPTGIVGLTYGKHGPINP